MLTDDELKAMEARWARATAGEWYAWPAPPSHAGWLVLARAPTAQAPLAHLCDAPPAYVADLAGGAARANAAFIAASKQDMPRLIAEVRRLRRQAAGAPATRRRE